MRTSVIPLLHTLAATFRSRAALQLGILALRQQLAVLHHGRPRRPHLRPVDRLFWLCLSKLWSGSTSPLIIVKPDTVVAWSRKGFRLFRTWKSRRGRSGRPAVPKDVRDLIRTMSLVNPLWGAPRLHGELLKLGIKSLTAHGGQVHGSSSQAALTDVAHFPGQPCPRFGVRGFLHGAHRHLLSPLRLHRARAPSSPRHPLQRHGAAYGCMNGAANR